MQNKLFHRHSGLQGAHTDLQWFNLHFGSVFPTLLLGFLAAMAHFSDDPQSDTVLQKIRAVFDSVRPLLIHGFKDVTSVTNIASLIPW